MNIDKLLKIVVSKNNSFFPLFEEAAKNISKASAEMQSMIGEEDAGKREAHISRIEAIEHEGDKLSQKIFEQLNRSFITPYDREDIQMMVSSMDDVLDNINGASRKFRLYKPQIVIPEIKLMAEVICLASQEIEIVMKGLTDAHKNKALIRKACINLNTLENRADDIYHDGISSLFANEKNAKELMKNKSILETLEKCIDSAEDISDTIKGILVKIA